MSPMSSPRSGPLVLLVEDSVADAQLVRLAFEEFDVKAELKHFSGADALLAFFSGSLSEAEVQQQKLIILDINLPRVSGIELLRKLRATERSRFIPVVILSSSNNQKDLQAAFEAGANSYVLKEPDFMRFGEQIRLMTTYWLSLNQQP